VLLGALVLLLLLVLKACGGDDGGPESLGSTPTTPPVSTPPTSEAPVPTATPTPTVTVAPVACTAGTGLRITAVADRMSYPLGTTARLTMTITNAGTAPCVVGLGQGSLEFRVASGNDRIWSSDDCSPGGPAGPAVLAPGEKRAAALSWSLTRSAPGCAGGRVVLKPGTYVLAARTGTTNSDKFSFRVTPAA
jgi:hypothetical protein